MKPTRRYSKMETNSLTKSITDWAAGATHVQRARLADRIRGLLEAVEHDEPIAPRPLTKRQRQVLGFVRQSIDRHGYAPSLSEIAGHFGLRSLATAHEHLLNPVQKRHIRRGVNESRAIEIVADA